MYYRTHKNKNRNLDVLLFVEHKDRELDIAVSISQLLEDDGLNVAIVSSVYHQIPALLTEKPKVIVTPFSGFGKGSVCELFYSVYGSSITYINLNYEQFISSWKGSYKTSIHEFSRNQQVQLVWGEYFKDELIKNGVNNTNIFITGRPSLSLIKARYSNCHQGNLLKFNSKFFNKKVCFIALTDGLAFLGKEKIDFIVKNGGERKGLESHVEYVKKNIKALFEDVAVTARANENIMFVMRPHPSIPESAYHSLFKNLGINVPPNILISKDENAYWWLAYSDWYVTNYSTLCLEAEVLGVKSYVYEKYANENEEDCWYTSSAIKVSELNSVFSTDTYDVTNEHPRTNYFIDFNKNGLLETKREISKRVTDTDVKAINSKLLVIIQNYRRTLGSLIRNVYALIGFVPFGKVSKGLLKDHFSASEVVKLKESIKNEL